MDQNTKEVLMAVIALISAISTPIVVWWVAAKTRVQITGLEDKVGVVESKLDENHKQMNGNIDKLVKTTELLATAKEKARAKGDEPPESPEQKIGEDKEKDVPKRE